MVITLANHNGRKEHNDETNCQAQENACELVTFGFGLVFHWLRKWRDFIEPITERSKAKSTNAKLYSAFN